MGKRAAVTAFVWNMIAVGALALAGCAGQGGANAPAGSAAEQTSLAPPATTAAGSVAASDYRIMSGDVLQIVVFQVQDFNRDAQVDGAGNIFLPLLGGIPVKGRTVRDVESDLTRRLAVKYVQNPQVSVSVKDAVGLRVSVQGAVKTPGVIQLHGETPLSAVIAQSGGFTDTADKSSVLVIRKTDQGRTAAKVDAGAILFDAAPDPLVYGGDTIVVQDSTIRTAMKDVFTLLSGAAAVKFLFP